MAAKKGTLGRVGEVAKGLATTVGNAAEKHVVKPVGKALGLTGSKAKGGAKTPAATVTKAAKPVVKAAKSTAKAAQRSAARATAAVKKAAPKVGGAKKTSSKKGK